MTGFVNNLTLDLLLQANHPPANELGVEAERKTSLIPLGLGSFELTCAGVLVSLGARLETALTATLLLRGFTVWLPMIPGLLLTRRALRAG
ncbi:MAG: hypothetical protein HGB15_00300 [Chlorobaculum sp.]|nr:hypothetical protein [Chlorobaculum sp.]